MPKLTRSEIIFFICGTFLISIAVWNLNLQKQSLLIQTSSIDQIPITLYQRSDGQRGPAVVIAHGFAGSQQLMQAFAISLAMNGFVAVTFDFAGHGRNPIPLSGNITQTDGATQFLVMEVQKISEFALSQGDGRLAVVGHSMASDVVVRAASLNPKISSTITISMFSPAVTSAIPRNLLVLVGDWEARLKGEALRAVSLFSSPEKALPDVTYGNFSQGNARRAVFISHAEHLSILYRTQSLREALNWLENVFDFKTSNALQVPNRGVWILLLFAGMVILIWPVTAVLPVVYPLTLGTARAGSKFWISLLVPVFLTPLVLHFIPTHILPILVADYLSVHFALYGALMALCIFITRNKQAPLSMPRISWGAFGISTVLLILFFFFGFILPINTYFTSFIPVFSRIPIIAILFIGTLLFFLSDEWLIRGEEAKKGASLFSKVAFLFSLSLAVILDFKGLFFLILIVPVIMLFFIIFEIVSARSYKKTRCPEIAAISNAFALAWSIGVTFPMLAG